MAMKPFNIKVFSICNIFTGRGGGYGGGGGGGGGYGGGSRGGIIVDSLMCFGLSLF